ncbi:unnamed protein product [Amoebophrya sp. A120]|nr:unnamed protein product [Amoebophrya sp. A120]|eukprot:GSA120T00019997001.1
MTGFLVAVVAVNVVLIGFEAADEMNNKPENQTSQEVADDFMFSSWWFVELGFFIIYLAEICLRFHAYEYRSLFFLRGDWFNNSLDSLLLALQIVELAGASNMGIDLGFMKMVRLARLTKLKASESICMTSAVLIESILESVFLFFLLFLLITVNATVVMVYRASFGKFEADSLEFGTTAFFSDYGAAVYTFVQLTLVDSVFDRFRELTGEAPVLGVLAILHILLGSIMIMSLVIGLVTDIQFRTQKAMRLQKKLESAVELANWLIVNVGAVDSHLNSLILARERRKEKDEEDGMGKGGINLLNKNNNKPLDGAAPGNNENEKDGVEEDVHLGGQKQATMKKADNDPSSPTSSTQDQQANASADAPPPEDITHAGPKESKPTGDHVVKHVLTKEQDTGPGREETQLRATQGLTIPVSVFYDPVVQRQMRVVGHVNEEHIPYVIISAIQETARAAGVPDDANLHSVTAMAVAESIYMRELDLGRDDVLTAFQETKRVRSFIGWQSRLQFLGMELQRLVLYTLGHILETRPEITTTNKQGGSPAAAKMSSKITYDPTSTSSSAGNYRVSTGTATGGTRPADDGVLASGSMIFPERGFAPTSTSPGTEYLLPSSGNSYKDRRDSTTSTTSVQLDPQRTGVASDQAPFSPAGSKGTTKLAVPRPHGVLPEGEGLQEGLRTTSSADHAGSDHELLLEESDTDEILFGAEARHLADAPAALHVHLDEALHIYENTVQNQNRTWSNQRNKNQNYQRKNNVRAEGEMAGELPAMSVQQGLLTPAMKRRLQERQEQGRSSLLSLFSTNSPPGFRSFDSLNRSTMANKHLVGVDHHAELHTLLLQQMASLERLTKEQDFSQDDYRQHILARCTGGRGVGGNKKGSLGAEMNNIEAPDAPAAGSSPLENKTTEARLLEIMELLYLKCEAENMLPSCGVKYHSASAAIVDDLVRDRLERQGSTLASVLQNRLQNALRSELLQQGMQIDTQVLQTRIGHTVS